MNKTDYHQVRYCGLRNEKICEISLYFLLNFSNINQKIENELLFVYKYQSVKPL